MRFLGRRVYLGAIVVLVSAMCNGLTARRVARLRALLGIDRRTLERWRRWWSEAFVETSFWRGERGRFRRPVRVDELPWSLVRQFQGKTRWRRLLETLEFLAPLTTTSSAR